MATVNVNSWPDFVQAVGVAGNTVVCPEDTVWDMNEIAPEGVAKITIACDEIQGNGLEIKNLVSTGGFYIEKAGGTTSVKANVLISGLSIHNILGHGGTNYSGTIGFIYAAKNQAVTIRQCSFSGIFANAVHRFFLADESSGSNQGYIYNELSAVNVELQANSAQIYRGYVTFNGSRVTAHLPNISGTLPLGTNANMIEINNEFVVYAPGVTQVTLRSCSASIVRGNLSACTSITGGSASAISIYSTDSAPNISNPPAAIKGVTDEQMKDASYLRSIGFIIGTEG